MNQAPRDASSVNRRWPILLTLLLGSAALVIFSDPPGAGRPSGPARAVERKPVSITEKRANPASTSALARTSSTTVIKSSTTSRMGAMSSETMILAITPSAPASTTNNQRVALGAHSWNPPPPPPSPSSPAAPPLPYTFLGKQQQDGRWRLFLGRADRTIIAKVGDVLDRTYRVDSIAPPQT